MQSDHTFIIPFLDSIIPTHVTELDRKHVRLACKQPRVRSPRLAHSFMEIGHEKISTAILLLPLIQKEQLSITGERMYTKYW